jgi:hypothetical protein
MVMSANVEVLGRGKFLALCDKCADGIRSHRRVFVEDWALNHNASEHEEES